MDDKRIDWEKIAKEMFITVGLAYHDLAHWDRIVQVERDAYTDAAMMAIKEYAAQMRALGYVLVKEESVNVLLLTAEHARDKMAYHSPIRLALINFRAANPALTAAAPERAGEDVLVKLVPGIDRIPGDCPNCEGTGTVPGEDAYGTALIPCHGCHGSGYFPPRVVR